MAFLISHYPAIQCCMQAPVVPLTRKCVVPSPADIEKTLVPPAFPNLPLAKSSELPQAPPDVPGGICNADLPTTSTLERYVWVVKQFVEQVGNMRCSHCRVGRMHWSKRHMTIVTQRTSNTWQRVCTIAARSHAASVACNIAPPAGSGQNSLTAKR